MLIYKLNHYQIVYFKIIIKKNYLKRKNYVILNKKIKPKVINISSNKKIIKIENILNNPSNLFSLFNVNNYLYPDLYYPGKKFSCPIKLQNEIKNLLLNINEKYYKISGDIYDYNCKLSLIDFNNDELSVQNIFPHRDCFEFKNNYKKSGLALIIYLCDTNENFCGTKFYEEKVPLYTDNFFQNEKYDLHRKYYKKLEGNSVNYETDFSLFFKELYQSKIKFNKCLIYPTNYYHSAFLKKNYGEKYNIKNRYTITAFMLFDKQINSNCTEEVTKLENNFDFLNNYYTNGYENDILNSRYKL